MKISMQTSTLVRRFGIVDAYRMIAEAGFTAIDWGLDAAWNFEKVLHAPTLSGLCIFEKSQEEILAHYAAELAEIRRHELTITQAHAPFRAFDFRRPEVLDYAISIYQNMIKFCHTVGCKHLVIHGISMREEDTETTRELCESYNKKMYESLIPVLRETDVVVCMENLFVRANSLGSTNFTAAICHDAHEAVNWIDTMNALAGRRAFGLCFDTGHLHLLRGDVRYYLPTLGDRICALHLHDNDQTGDNHLLPYAGSFRWDWLLTALREIGYAGDLSFETCGQISAKRLPNALVPAFLRVTYEIGAYFKAELEK